MVTERNYNKDRRHIPSRCLPILDNLEPVVISREQYVICKDILEARIPAVRVWRSFYESTEPYESFVRSSCLFQDLLTDWTVKWNRLLRERICIGNCRCS